MHRAVKMRRGLTSSGKTFQSLPSRNIRLCCHHQENSRIWWVIFRNIFSMKSPDNSPLGRPCWCSQTGKTYRGGWNDKFFFAFVCSSGFLSTARSYFPWLSHSWLAQVFDDYIYHVLHIFVCLQIIHLLCFIGCNRAGVDPRVELVPNVKLLFGKWDALFSRYYYLSNSLCRELSHTMFCRMNEPPTYHIKAGRQGRIRIALEFKGISEIWYLLIPTIRWSTW